MAAVVHIIDDDASLREALDSLFRSTGLTARLYESTSAFMDAEIPDEPACIVLDVRLPGMSGLDFQEKLAELGVQLPVVLMTGHGDIPMSVRAMKAGALPTAGKVYWDGVVSGGAGPITWNSKTRAPLLLIGGGIDLIAPASMTKAIFNKQKRAKSLTEFKLYEDRSHYLCAEPGWEEVADYALAWAERNQRPANVTSIGSRAA